MGTITDPLGGYRQHLELVAESQQGELGAVPGADLIRNAWQLATVNPDDTDLAQWAGVSGIGYESFINHAYGGSFASDGTLYANFFPQYNLTEAAGFGGIRHYPRGPHGYISILGITDENYELVRPGSFHVFKGAYAAEPEVLPDGRLIVSRIGLSPHWMPAIFRSGRWAVTELWLSISAILPVTVKMTRSQMLTTRSPVRSRPCAAHIR